MEASPVRSGKCPRRHSVAAGAGEGSAAGGRTGVGCRGGSDDRGHGCHGGVRRGHGSRPRH